MLTIDRNVDESIYLNDKKVIVKQISNAFVRIKIEDNYFSIKRKEYIKLENTKIYFVRKLNSKDKTINRARIGFDADMSITIMRGEIYETNKGNSKYTDNSTKQFPSGEF